MRYSADLKLIRSIKAVRIKVIRDSNSTTYPLALMCMFCRLMRIGSCVRYTFF